MNVPIRDTWKLVEDALKLHDKATIAAIKRECQKHYYNLCAMTDWLALRQVTELTFTGDETDGEYLPSDLIGIMAVISETSGSRRAYSPTEEQRRYLDRDKYRWYHPNVKVTPLDTYPGTSVSVSNEGTTFSGSLGGDRTGEYIRFHSEPGLYLLTASDTFTPAYLGPRITNKGCVVRPSETSKLVLVAPDGQTTDDTVQVYYWAYPEPLYEDWQVPQLPSNRPLELLTLITMLGPIDKRHREVEAYRQEYEDRVTHAGAFSDMLAMNPKFVSPAVPRGRTGRISYMGRRR